MEARLTQKAIDTMRTDGRRAVLHDTEVRGLQCRISATGHKSYSVMYRTADGKRTRYTLGSATILTLAQARDKARRVLAQVLEGTDPQAAKQAVRKEFTLAQFIEAEFAPYIEKTKSGARTLDMLRRHFAFLMDVKLDAISKADVMRWQNRCTHEGRKATTVNRNLAALRTCLSYAVRLGVLESHPLAGVKDRKNDSTPKVRFLDAEEERRLYAALDAREERRRRERDSGNAWRRERGRTELHPIQEGEYTDHLYPMIVLSLNTGVRRGECFSIEWRDVDLERAVLTIRAEIAKSGRARHIPLNSTTLDTLTRWRAQTSGSGLVFPSADGKRFDTVKRVWAGIVKQAELKDFTWHSMRHDFASKLAMRGVDLNTVRELLGHADYKMVLVYAHLSPEHKRAAVSALDKRPGNVVSFSQAADGAE